VIVCPKDTRLPNIQCGNLTDNQAGASEPANRGIGVSVPVVQRVTIAHMRAWDALGRSHAELAPTAAILNYRIQRHTQAEIDGGAEPYAVRFESGGREYWCALALFQARTQALQPDGAADAIAV
jgi:hypothetical protein